MADLISLQNLRQSLFQPNKAIKKRALGILFNDEMVEAEDLLREFLGEEQDPELQVIGHKVLQKLHDCHQFSLTMDVAMVAPLLKSSDPNTRIRALRRLYRRRHPTLAGIMQSHCSQEDVPEVALLIVSILNENPHPGNLALITKFLDSGSEALRLEAFRSLHLLMNASLIPLFFKGLVDFSKEIQLTTMQIIRHFPRTYLLDALDSMLGGAPEHSQLASKVLAQLQGSDLLPLLKRHLNHPDPTTSLFLRTFHEYMSGRGEAAPEVPKPQVVSAGATPGPLPVKPVKPAGPTAEELLAGRMAALFKTFTKSVQESWADTPVLFLQALRENPAPQRPREFLQILKNIFDRIRYLFSVAGITLYFRKGNRSLTADRTCFRTLQRGVLGVNTLELLQSLAPSFPEPAGAGDLFPLVISHISNKELDDEAFFDPFLSLQEGLSLMADHPEEIENFLPAAIDSLATMLRNLSGPLQANRLLVKQVLPEGVKVWDFMHAKPVQINPKAVAFINLPHHAGVLVSQDSLNSISLDPFLRYQEAQRTLGFGALNEHALWDFLKKYEVSEAYMAFLQEASVG